MAVSQFQGDPGETPWREKKLGLGFDTETGSMTYKFNILNLGKPDSLFNRGMKPVVYSAKE